MAKRKIIIRCSIGLLIVLLCMGTAVGIWTVTRAMTDNIQSYIRCELPTTASDIHDKYIDMSPDFTYILRAQIPPEDFPRFVARIGLTPHTSSRSYTDDIMWLEWETSQALSPWWDPSSSRDDTFVKQDGGVWMFAKYENGRLYFKAWSH